MATEEAIKAEMEQIAHATNVELAAARQRIVDKSLAKQPLAEYDLRTILNAQYEQELYGWFIAAMAEEGATPSSALRKVRQAATQEVFHAQRKTEPIAKGMQEQRFMVLKMFVLSANSLLGEEG